VAKRILGIIESAYRATIEEQDDTVVWFTHAVKAGGADVTVVLRGNAVNYAARGQNAAGLQIGDWKQTQPPDVAGDVTRLIARGVEVYVVDDDAVARGLGRSELIDGVKPVDRAGLAALVARHDTIWHW
jgi:intracellular sulfur oxidation DsrE/DsrF family protein